ncbi:MAG TPA: hypothetical protein VMV94_06770 [Phycisphaerae bacterium]|nr:hypothetical protein [Phycisphaerae bacterium]
MSSGITPQDPPPALVVHLPRALVFTLLFFLFDLAYILSPYWNLASHTSSRTALLASSVVIGLVWAIWASAPLSAAFSGARAWRLLGAFLILAILNARALTADVPWRGDEDHHLLATRSLIGALLSHRSATIALILLLAILPLAAWRLKSLRLAVLLCLMLAIIQGVWIAHTDPDFFEMTRYPMISRWFASAPIVLLSVFRNMHLPFTGPLDEALHRLVPFIAAVLLVWITAARAAPASPIGSVLCLLALASVPLLYRYSSILYLELPAVFLMTVACFSARVLLTRDYDEIRRSPAWLALISIGFVKETTAPFLLAFLLCRAFARLSFLRKAERPLRAFLHEVLVGFCVLCPPMCWFGYRFAHHVSRPGPSQFGNLLRLDLYSILPHSWLEQFGPLLAASILGTVILLRRRQFIEIGFFAAAFVADVFMHVADFPAYLGHSRFNLFLLPMILVTASFALRALDQVSTAGMAILCSMLFVAHLAMSPVNLDGSKKPTWGDYSCDISEHYYPYRSAIRWLNENSRGRQVLATGLTYPYQFDFYAAPSTHIDLLPATDPAPNTDAASARAALESAREKSYDLVLHALAGRDVPRVDDMCGYAVRKIFRNSAHALILYERTTAP